MGVWSVLLLALVATSVSGRKWQYDAYPARGDTRCNVDGGDTLLCDPDEVLTVEERTELNSLLVNGIRGGTACPCSTNMCDTGKYGYQVGVAIMEEMDIPDEYEVDHSLAQRRLHAAYRMSGQLLTSTWQIGRCDEDAIIIYSLKDGVVYIVTSAKARVMLPDQRVGEIIRDSGEAFSNGRRPARGLKRIIQQVRDSLKGLYGRHKYNEYKTEDSEANRADELRTGESGGSGHGHKLATSVATLVVLLVTALVL